MAEIVIAQLGDLHLGRRWLGLVGDDGVNLREDDLYRSLAVVERWLIEDVKPDLAVIAGDLFDSVNPTTAARSAAFRMVAALSGAGIELVVIGGNHDQASRSQPSPLDHLAEFFGATVALSQQSHDARCGARLHLVPYASLAQAASGGEPLAPFDFADGRPNVLVAHAYTPCDALRPIPERVVLAPELISNPRFDLVLLGHIHRHLRIGESPPAFYSGTLENLSFGEKAEEPAVWIHRHGAGGFINTSQRIADLGTEGVPRPMHLIRISAAGEPAETDRLIRSALAERELTGSLVQIVVDEAQASLRVSGLATRWPDLARAAGALWCEVALRPATRALQGGAETSAEAGGRLEDMFRDFLLARDEAPLVDLALTTLEAVE